MGTPGTPVVTNAPAAAAGSSAASVTTKASFVQKLEAWFKKLGGEIEEALTSVFGSSVAKDIETAVKGVLGTAFGSIAIEAVTAATDVETGKINVSQAAASIQQAAAAAGKTLGNSTVNLLIAAAQQALESKLGITTSTV